MPTGFRNNAGVDLEDLFEAGTLQVAGFRLSSGSNVAFAARGSATKIPDVGFRDAAGSDVSNSWLGKGSGPPVLGFNGQFYAASSQAPTGASANAVATLTLTLTNAGAWTITRSISGSVSGNGTTTLASGTWLPSGGAVSNYEVQFALTPSGDGTTTNTATTFSSLSTSRVASLQVSAAAASSDLLNGAVGISCALRQIGGGASVSTTSFSCSASGYL